MKIVPYLRWQTFRYWAVIVTDVWGMGSSPDGGLQNSSTDFNPQQSQQLISTASTLPVIFKNIHNANPKQFNAGSMYSYLHQCMKQK